MIKLLLTLLMMFTFGLSTVNAEENSISIEDRISELAETETASRSSIIARIDELSEDELKAIVANVNEMTEPTEADLTIKEAATNKLEEMKSIGELSPLTIGLGVLGLLLMFSSFIMLFTGYIDESTWTFIVGLILVMVVKLFTKL